MLLGYADIQGDLLPINNDENFHKAVSSANPLLRIIITKKGKTSCYPNINFVPAFLKTNSITRDRDTVVRPLMVGQKTVPLGHKVFVDLALSLQKECLLLQLSLRLTQDI